MPASRKMLALCLSAIIVSTASTVSAQSIDLLRYGAGLGPYESDGHDDEPIAPAPEPQQRAASGKVTRARTRGGCSQRYWDAVKGWVNSSAPCR